MAKRRKPRLGQLSVRVPVEAHQQLLDVAAVLGSDVSGLVNQIIAEGLPPFVTKATELARRQKAAREEFTAVTYVLPDVPGGDDLVKVAMDAGRTVEGDSERVEAMLQSINSQAPPGTLGRILMLAVDGLTREAERKRLQDLIEGALADLTGTDEELPG